MLPTSRQTRTKIVATVGPASNTYEMLRALIEEGVDVFRLNFSHGTYADHLAVINLVRRLNKDLRTNVCLLQDLQGPKIRLGEVEGGQVEINRGDRIKLVCGEKEITTATRLSTIYMGLAADVKPGDAILLDDGKLELKVIATDGKREVDVEVIYGGVVKPRKGINLPDSNVSAPSLTEKDIEDLQFGLEHGVEWVALSFVRTADDIRYIKQLIADAGSTARVIAKVEKPEAMKNMHEIVAISDAVMVARGDLGVEVGMEAVPMMQKRLVAACNAAGKPVIVATQMMESMITAPRPTRAETNDVANAVMDGADALMLSAETAAGQYPIETIRSMHRTIASVEAEADLYYKPVPFDRTDPLFLSASLVASACGLARDTDARAIIGMTRSGYTAFQLARNRPKARIFIFTDNRELLNLLNLVWGIQGFYYDRFNSSDSIVADIKYVLMTTGNLQTGDVFVNTGSVPIAEKGPTNFMKVSVA